MGANIKFKNIKQYYGEPVGDIIASYSPNLKGIKLNLMILQVLLMKYQSY